MSNRECAESDTEFVVRTKNLFIWDSSGIDLGSENIPLTESNVVSFVF
ncbi:MAG TPA: hypothetical protein VJV96_17875 [Candidatus Angelobacter sp.]|nr:hypothetical protein [Candidatus Angelobacter sp.]